MKRVKRILLAALLSVAAVPTMAQDQSPLDFDDLVGVWDMAYENGQTGTFTMSRNDDGTPKIVVSTSTGGDSEARDIEMEDDVISFSRDINVQGQAISVTYKAKLIDGKLEGTGEVDLGGFGGGAAGGAGGGPTAFTATRAQ